MAKIKWRLGLDVGTNSLGWAVIRLDEANRACGIENAGVRIFSNSRATGTVKTGGIGPSLAVRRREKRGMRRILHRRHTRRDEFMQALLKHGLMPADKSARKELEKLNPWELRARGMREPLKLYELGRVLFHLQQRRGFKSNRKTDEATKESLKEAKKIASAGQKTKELMADENAKTFGEFLGKGWLDEHSHRSTRARLHSLDGERTYTHYPLRDMIEDEFDQLWNAQQKHYPELTDVAREELRGILSFQRDLRPPLVGRCTLEPNDARAPWALPSSQLRRFYEKLHALRYVDTQTGEEISLSNAQRNAVMEAALGQKTISFGAIRKELKLPRDSEFNLEDKKNKKIDCDQTSAELAKEEFWGDAWHQLPLVKKDAIVEILLGLNPSENMPRYLEELHGRITAKVRTALGQEAADLLTEKDDAKKAAWLARNFSLPEEAAARIVKVHLPSGYQNLGRIATDKMLQVWGEHKEQDAPLVYSEAAKAAGYNHSDTGQKQALHRLPYYGEVLRGSVAFGTGDENEANVEKRVGKIANPTVHVALNQIRKVVNALIDLYGKPEEVTIETARDLPLSERGKSEIIKQQTANQQARQKRIQRLIDGGMREDAISDDDIKKVRLLEELENATKGVCVRCIYKPDEVLSIQKIINGEAEADHILPRSKTHDNNFSNLLLISQAANREKAGRTPHEAYGNSEKYAGILAYANELPKNKRWRFAKNAMEKYRELNKFRDRQINDTRYVARLCIRYLGALFGGARETPKHVWCIPGGVTKELRDCWRMNYILSQDGRKNRNDHRHHAVDAVTIGLAELGMLQRAATNAARTAKPLSRRILHGVGHPQWKGYWDDAKSIVDGITVSHKLKHGIAGELHNETAYGLQKEGEPGNRKLVLRQKIADLKKNQIKNIVSDAIQERLLQLTEHLGEKDAKQALERYVAQEQNPKRVKVRQHFTEEIVTKLKDDDERIVAVRSYYCYDIYEDDKGKWHLQAISMLEANKPNGPVRKNGKPRHPRKGRLMWLRKGDTIAVEREYSARELMVVVQLNPSLKQIQMINLRDAGKNLEPVGMTKLKQWKARIVRVDEIGRIIHDPGFQSGRAHS